MAITTLRVGRDNAATTAPAAKGRGTGALGFYQGATSTNPKTVFTHEQLNEIVEEIRNAVVAYIPQFDTPANYNKKTLLRDAIQIAVRNVNSVVSGIPRVYAQETRPDPTAATTVLASQWIELTSAGIPTGNEYVLVDVSGTKTWQQTKGSVTIFDPPSVIAGRGQQTGNGTFSTPYDQFSELEFGVDTGFTGQVPHRYVPMRQLVSTFRQFGFASSETNAGDAITFVNATSTTSFSYVVQNAGSLYRITGIY